MKTLRQGDWSFKPIDASEYESLCKDVKPLKQEKAITFAEGEATGHFHTLHVKDKDNMSMYKLPDGSFVVHIKNETATVTHPEHSMKVDLEVAPNYFRLYQRREKDWMSLVTRIVID